MVDIMDIRNTARCRKLIDQINNDMKMIESLKRSTYSELIIHPYETPDTIDIRILKNEKLHGYLIKYFEEDIESCKAEFKELTIN